MLETMNDIRRFRLDVRATATQRWSGYLEFRILEPHKRNIPLANGRTVCVPFPHTLCYAGMDVKDHTRRYQHHIAFMGMGFLPSSFKLSTSALILVPPIPHFTGFMPNCHPLSDEIGRDQFEMDFNGFFGSPFESDGFYSHSNHEAFKALGSYREWAKLDIDRVLAKLEKHVLPLSQMVNASLGDGIFGAGKSDVDLVEMEPIKGERINGS